MYYTPAIDVWSVGCLFAELLTNKNLFVTAHARKILSETYGECSLLNNNYLYDFLAYDATTCIIN